MYKVSTGLNSERTIRTPQECSAEAQLKNVHEHLLENVGANWNYHSIATLKRQSLSKILFLDWVYKLLVGKPGVIVEFGVQWGASFNVLSCLRGMYEPYNHQRRLYGFDTFRGFPSTSEIDGDGPVKGDYGVSSAWQDLFENLLNLQRAFSPLSHIQKDFLIVGDVQSTLSQWLEENPAELIGLAIFDLDLYEPTKHALELIKPRLFKGSVLVFDELSCPYWPGETAALAEVLEINKLKLKHFPHHPNASVFEFEG